MPFVFLLLFLVDVVLAWRCEVGAVCLVGGLCVCEIVDGKVEADVPGRVPFLLG